MGSATKIVFLIDTSSDIDNPDTATQRAQSICLSCLRLLLFSSSKAEKAGTTKKSKISLTNVKWGYKFYSSKTVKTKIEFHRFYDFKLKYFEEFENEVQRRFDNSTVSSSFVKPSIAVSKALTELLSDFPWEGPDISSPVKGRKAPKHLTQRRNFVYLYTNCPRTSSQLKAFSGKRVLDADVFLDSFLPSSLFTEFCYTSKLSLNWVDTGGLQRRCNDQTADLSSIHIVESSVSKANGHVFPLGSLVQNGSPYFVDIQSLMVNASDAESGEAVHNSKQSTQNQPRIIPISTTFEHLETGASDVPGPSFDTVLKVCGIEISLDIFPSTKNSVNSSFHEAMEDTVDLTTTSNITSILDFSPSSLRAYSLLDKSSFSQMLLPDKCYVCAEADNSRGRKAAGSMGHFRKLLSTLATRSLSLVLVCEDTGQLAVLQPLTIHTACVYNLSKGTSLSMEKLLIQQVTQQDHVTKEVSTKQTSSDHLVEKLLAGKKFRPLQVDVGVTAGPATLLDAKLMDRWHLPGPKSSFKSLIQKLNVRIKDLEFLTKEETNVLKQLQKAYKLEKKPPGVRDTPKINTNPERDAEEEKKSEFELPFIGKKSRTSISRAEMILSKSKEVVKVRGHSEKEGLDKTKDRLDRDKPEVAAQVADFKNIEELKEFLTSTYERVLTGESTCVDMNVQTAVTVTLHYLKQTGIDGPEDECHKVLSGCLVLSASTLREKYSNKSDVSVELKIAEYQFQIVLRMEMLSTLINKDQTIGEEESNDEVVGMLRTLSFMCEPGALSKFMESCLLYNYIHTIPKTLANIYDELMQPLPDLLSNILSPNNSSADHSVFDSSLVNEGGPPSARTRSHASVGPASNQPGSNKSFTLDTSLNNIRGSRKLVHHPSLADFGAKRQIVVEKVPKQKEKSSRKRRESGKHGKEKVAKSLFDKTRGTKLERRQSVAVMQTTQKTPKKAQARLNFKSPVSNSSRPSRKSLVAETPQHKQLSRSFLQKDNVLDQLDDTDVVEESPEKACSEVRKDTPTKGKRAKALMRRSFYSAGPMKRTRNLTQYFQLADRIAGRQRHPSNQSQNKLPKLISLEGDKQFKSPEKNSSFLLSQIVYSPSPNKCTPKKLNQTPSKLLFDSPCRNTRSRNPSGAAGLANLFGSPTDKPSGNLQQRVASPSRRLLQSPHGRRQSPCVLVLESTTKSEEVTHNKTPEKSPICGAITSGLDSPSQNTRLKISATPTRRSVRAALFSKSPAMCRTQSPRAAYASPRTLLAKFGSPQKQVINDNRPSPKRNLLDFDGCFKMGQKTGSNEIDKPGSENIQKTPSPHSKKTNETPDSFDKWHRRKHNSQLSPAPPKCVSTTVGSKVKDFSSPIKSSFISSLETRSPLRKKRILISSPDRAVETKSSLLDSLETRSPLRKKRNLNSSPERTVETKSSLLSSLDTRSPLRKKRTLISSPDRPVESPSKRRRTSRLDSLSSVSRGSIFNSTMIRDGSQGFDVNSPLQMSQSSVASSMDYFSATNDEVFLSQSQPKSQIQSPRKLESMEVDDIFDIRLRKVKSKDKGSSLIKNRTLEKICSSDFPCSGETERSESPIFFTSARNSPKHRHVSGDRFLPNRENIRVDGNFSPVNSASNSPGFGKSPGEKKYSPNVSAKSLMHLMNSPLVNNSDKNEARSRRSLRLQI